MAQSLEEMPLFTLETVLFPYATLALSVFEQRYLEMVRMCLAEDRPFGVVLIRSGNEVGETADPYLVGTVVHIQEAETYEDGRMHLIVQGQRRFRIRRLDDSRPYLVGYVEPVHEHAIQDAERAAEMLREAREEFELLVRDLLDRTEFSVSIRFPTDPAVLTFTLANFLHMENLQKQRILETTDTLERLEELLPLMRNRHLEAEAPAVVRMRLKDLAETIVPN
jgi:Lon protease-like protein